MSKCKCGRLKDWHEGISGERVGPGINFAYGDDIYLPCEKFTPADSPDAERVGEEDLDEMLERYMSEQSWSELDGVGLRHLFKCFAVRVADARNRTLSSRLAEAEQQNADLIEKNKALSERNRVLEAMIEQAGSLVVSPENSIYKVENGKWAYWSDDEMAEHQFDSAVEAFSALEGKQESGETA